MNAEWNAEVINGMEPEQNLRNTCRQIEQSYVEWRRPATYRGSRLLRQWPAIGELGCLTAGRCVVQFITTRERSIVVQNSDGIVKGEVPMRMGMAQELYELAALIAEECPHSPMHKVLTELAGHSLEG